MVDRLSIASLVGFGILIFSSVSLSVALPDPDLVAELDTVPLSYPQDLLPNEHARPLATESTLAYSYRPAFHEKRYSFVIPSIVVHGFAIDKDVAAQMPNRLDNGQTVVTPGVGLEYVSAGGFLMLGGVLKDCYDDLAGLIQIGQQFRLGSRTSIGYSIGIYARETPIACTTTFNRRGRATTTCDEFDSYNLKWTTQVNNEPVDIIPMPFLHFTTALYKGNDFELDFKILSNFALNEFGFSVPF
jgi:hypothetical protein